jgi:hypothetical protein
VGSGRPGEPGVSMSGSESERRWAGRRRGLGAGEGGTYECRASAGGAVVELERERTPVLVVLIAYGCGFGACLRALDGANVGCVADDGGDVARTAVDIVVGGMRVVVAVVVNVRVGVMELVCVFEVDKIGSAAVYCVVKEDVYAFRQRRRQAREQGTGTARTGNGPLGPGLRPAVPTVLVDVHDTAPRSNVCDSRFDIDLSQPLDVRRRSNAFRSKRNALCGKPSGAQRGRGPFGPIGCG